MFIELLVALTESGTPTLSSGDSDGEGSSQFGAFLTQLLAITWLQQVLLAVLALIVALVVYRILARLLRHFSRQHPLLEGMQEQLLLIMRWLYLPLALLAILLVAGVNVGELLTVVTGVLAVIAIGFVAVWSVASNVMAAFLIIATGLFRVGQYVQFTNPLGDDGFCGQVRDIRMLFTILEEVRKDGKETGEVATVRIPNNVFFQNPIRVTKTLPAHVVKPPEEQKDDEQG